MHQVFGSGDFQFCALSPSTNAYANPKILVLPVWVFDDDAAAARANRLSVGKSGYHVSNVSTTRKAYDGKSALHTRHTNNR